LKANDRERENGFYYKHFNFQQGNPELETRVPLVNQWPLL